MDKVSRYAQFGANMATMVIAVLLASLVIRDSSAPPRIPATIAPSTSSNAAAPAISPVGQKVPLPGVDWARNKKTLVMYVSSKCRFCTESGPFYERITSERGNDVNFIAVMPQPVDEGREYLSKLGVKITDVYQAPLQPIGVRSTPTLLLVDGSGVVTDSWVGKLTPEREDHVKSKLTE